MFSAWLSPHEFQVLDERVTKLGLQDRSSFIRYALRPRTEEVPKEIIDVAMKGLRDHPNIDKRVLRKAFQEIYLKGLRDGEAFRKKAGSEK